MNRGAAIAGALGGATIDGLYIEDSGGCADAIRIWDREDVSITNSGIDGSYEHTLWIRGASNVEVSNTWLQAGSGTSASSIGVYLDYALTPKGNVVEDVVIQHSTSVGGYSLPYVFTNGQATGDGDTVGVCAVEPAPKPALCN